MTVFFPPFIQEQKKVKDGNEKVLLDKIMYTSLDMNNNFGFILFVFCFHIQNIYLFGFLFRVLFAQQEQIDFF